MRCEFIHDGNGKPQLHRQKKKWPHQGLFSSRVAVPFAVLNNPFTTGNPFLGTKLLEFSIGRGSGALKGLSFVLVL